MATVASLPEVKPCITSQMNPPINPTLVAGPEGLQEVKDFLDSVTEFGFDVETNVVPTFFHRRIRTIQLGNRDKQFVIDLLGFAGRTDRLVNGQGNYTPGPEFKCLIDTVRPALESNRCLKLGTNLQFDYETVKWCLGLRPWHFYDCRLAEVILLCGLINPKASGYFALDDMVRKYLRLEISKEEQKGFDLVTPLTQSQIEYCALDTRLPLGIRTAQTRILARDGLSRIARIEFDSVPAFGDMHLNGMYASREAWQKIINATAALAKDDVSRLDEFFIPVVGRKGLPDIDVAKLEQEWRTAKEEGRSSREIFRAYQSGKSAITKASKEMETYEGDAALNYGSPEQLKAALWKFKGLNTRTLPNTDDNTLKKLAPNFPVIKALQDYREHSKVLTTYGIQFLDKYTDPNTGRIHSNIWQIGADTGRTASDSPNVQNLPPELRKCIEGQNGRQISASDMSGAELRIITEVSKEPSWIDAFHNKYDVHSIGASIVFSKRVSKFLAWIEGVEDGCAFTATKQKCKCKLHKLLRGIAKAINFGIAYGMTEYRLSAELGISLDGAREILNAYRAAFCLLLDALNSLGKSALCRLEARTLTGRRRIFQKPTWELAREKAQKKWTTKLKNEGPVPAYEIMKLNKAMIGSVEREGKNQPIQGTNVDIAKIAMGCGFDKNGEPFMWHRLEPVYESKLINFVHDEFVTEQEKERSEGAAGWVRNCIERAGDEVLTVVHMESESSTHHNWCKD